MSARKHNNIEIGQKMQRKRQGNKYTLTDCPLCNAWIHKSQDYFHSNFRNKPTYPRPPPFFIEIQTRNILPVGNYMGFIKSPYNFHHHQHPGDKFTNTSFLSRTMDLIAFSCCRLSLWIPNLSQTFLNASKTWHLPQFSFTRALVCFTCNTRV